MFVSPRFLLIEDAELVKEYREQQNQLVAHSIKAQQLKKVLVQSLTKDGGSPFKDVTTNDQVRADFDLKSTLEHR
jgi:hypothetical protein